MDFLNHMTQEQRNMSALIIILTAILLPLTVCLIGNWGKPKPNRKTNYYSGESRRLNWFERMMTHIGIIRLRR